MFQAWGQVWETRVNVLTDHSLFLLTSLHQHSRSSCHKNLPIFLKGRSQCPFFLLPLADDMNSKFLHSPFILASHLDFDSFLLCFPSDCKSFSGTLFPPTFLENAPWLSFSILQAYQLFPLLFTNISEIFPHEKTSFALTLPPLDVFKCFSTLLCKVSWENTICS